MNQLAPIGDYVGAANLQFGHLEVAIDVWIATIFNVAACRHLNRAAFRAAVVPQLAVASCIRQIKEADVMGTFGYAEQRRPVIVTEIAGGDCYISTTIV